MRLALGAATVLLQGCVSTPRVYDATKEESLNTLATTCSSPYQLTRDCSNMSGAMRKVKMGEVVLAVAGSDDGRVVMVMDPSAVSHALSDFFLLNSPTHSQANNSGYYTLSQFLATKGVTVTRVRAMESLGNIDGYMLELDKDGYSLLEALPVVADAPVYKPFQQGN